MPDLLLGVDIGTSMTKGVACTIDGQIVVSAAASHQVAMPRTGWFEQDGDRDWWDGFCAVTRELLDHPDVDASRVISLGCSAMTPNMLALDQRGSPVRSAILYCDTRATEVYPAILQHVSVDEISALGGFRLTMHGGWQGGQLLWMREHEPELYHLTSKVVSTTGYIVYRLTGQFTADRATARCNVPFYDQHKKGWSREMCELLGVSPGLFPDRIGLATDIAAGVTAEAAHECGLRAGTPVIIGTMDTNADMLAAGVSEPGDLGLVYGTSLIAAVCLPELARPNLAGPNLGPCSGGMARVPTRNDFVIPGLFLCGTGVQTAGVLTEWFRETLRWERLAPPRGAPPARHLLFQAPAVGPAVGPGVESGLFTRSDRVNEAISYEQLGALAAAVPAGADGLLIVPEFAGEKRLLGGRLASGAMLGLTTYHGKGHIYRALLEGTAYQLRFELSRLALSLGRAASATRVYSVGGGTRNSVWVQIMSDVLDVPQTCYRETFGAPFGDAYLAGLGVGVFTDFETLRGCWLRGGVDTSPQPELRLVYDRTYQDYVDALVLLGLAEAQ